MISTVIVDSTTYCICRGQVPTTYQLPWGDEECDAFVAILDPQMLNAVLAAQLAKGLVDLDTDWVETMGKKSEYLHDTVDLASVAAGRQTKVGDGSPMTVWDDDMTDFEAMVDYVQLGGQGAFDNKLVIVVGPKSAAVAFADRIGRSPQP